MLLCPSALVVSIVVAMSAGTGLAMAADADTAAGASRASGYDPGEGFVLRSPDGNNALRIGLEGAYRFEPKYLNGVSQDRVAILSARPSLAGNVVRPWIKFLTTAELADNPPYLLYAYLDVRPVKAFGIRAGQQDTPFSRHESFGLYRVLFPETGPVADYFWTGRDKGVTAYGSLDADRLDYYAGYYGGSPLRQFTTIAGNYVVEGRVTVNPMGKVGETEYAYVLGDAPAPTRFSFTLQGYLGKIQDASENFDSDTFLYQATPSGTTNKERAGGADLFFQSRRLMFTTEGYLRRTYPDGSPSYLSLGLWGQLGVLLLPKRLDAAVRISWTNPSTTLADDLFFSAEGQLAYYISAPTLIVKLRYGYGNQQSPGMSALGAVTLPATAGRTQLITFQINLSF
jgi:Phosphate-selective porin O and P